MIEDLSSGIMLRYKTRTLYLSNKKVAEPHGLSEREVITCEMLDKPTQLLSNVGKIANYMYHCQTYKQFTKVFKCEVSKTRTNQQN